LSASKKDPFVRRVRPVALAPSELVGVAETARARLLDRILATKTTVHVADVAAEPIYTEEREPTIVAAVELGGVRTLLAVPFLKENEPIGAFAIYRKEIRPFTNRQIALV
jgi:hypothetical protein